MKECKEKSYCTHCSNEDETKSEEKLLLRQERDKKGKNEVTIWRSGKTE